MKKYLQVFLLILISAIFMTIANQFTSIDPSQSGLKVVGITMFVTGSIFQRIMYRS